MEKKILIRLAVLYEKELRLNSDHVSSQKVENKSDNRGENGLVPFFVYTVTASSNSQ